MLTVLSLPLGACSSLFGVHFADRQPGASPVEAAASVASKTTLGRQQLANGQVGAAIETFQAALAAGEDRAPAINGLGVAYARLGRSDLALRYFEEATSIAPSDARYASNLALLLNSQTSNQMPALASALPAQPAAPEPVAIKGQLQRVSTNEFHIATADLQPAPYRGLAVQVASRSQPAAQSAPARAVKLPLSPLTASPAQRPAVVRVAASDGRLQRVSAGEVHIATVEPKQAPVASKADNLDRRFHPVVRIALADVPNRRPVGFIRIVLPDVERESTP